MGSVVKAPSKIISAYLDESGAVRASSAFVAGLFFTSHPDLWKKIIQERRSAEDYWYELHFKKVSRNPDDRRAKTIERVLFALDKVKRSWWSRLIYVPNGSADKYRGMSRLDLYDNLVANLAIKFGPAAYCDQIELIIDNKNRPADDTFLPHGLEEHLNRVSPEAGGPFFTVIMGDSKTDDLLQLCDLITSGIRQYYVPSDNFIKKYFAGMLASFIDDRIKIWKCE